MTKLLLVLWHHGLFLIEANDDSRVIISSGSRFIEPAAKGVDSYVVVILFTEEIIDTKVGTKVPVSLPIFVTNAEIRDCIFSH